MLNLFWTHNQYAIRFLKTFTTEFWFNVLHKIIKKRVFVR
jgi:hypothetical protein